MPIGLIRDNDEINTNAFSVFVNSIAIMISNLLLIGSRRAKISVRCRARRIATEYRLPTTYYLRLAVVRFEMVPDALSVTYMR